MTDDVGAFVVLTYAVSVVIGFCGLLVGGYLAWAYAPVVGGQWWPYIHAVATGVSAIVGLKAGLLAGFWGAILCMIIYAVTIEYVPIDTRQP